MPSGQVEFLEHDGARLAFERVAGAAPTFVWLGGFKSDMSGTKAQTLSDWAARKGQAFVRFDYAGHGQSSGRFETGTISSWFEDTLRIIDRLTSGPLVLVGSSMGGWLALLAARARPKRVKALLLIAPAADFTERLIWNGFNDAQKDALLRAGRIEMLSQYAPEPTIVTRALIEDGRRHLVMEAPFPFSGPISILHGAADRDVPVEHSHDLAASLQGASIHMQVIFDGDHRLSRPQDLELLIRAADALARSAG